MITFDNITVIYDGKPLMVYFSETINPGEKVVLYGPSGSGKSTLLASIAGFVKPDSGVISVKGLPVNARNIDQIRQFIAWVPQELALPYVWVREMVDAPFLLKSNLRQQPSRERVISVLSGLGLEPDIYDKKVTEISGGQRQRIMIAIAVLLEKEIILLDEPTSALDADSTDKMIDFLRGLSGKTIVAVSHDLKFRSSFDRSIKIDG